jgi:cyanate permease
MRKGGRGRPLNSALDGISVPMTKHSEPAFRGSFPGAVLGIVFLALALFVAVPVAVNFPDSWPGAVLVLALLCVGAVLIRAHLVREHRAKPKGPGNAI